MADDVETLDWLLTAIETSIVPKTRVGVASGNKIFGAALLDRASGEVVLAETNNETENPLWHGEVHALKRFYKLPRDDRPETSRLLFLSTHEPCTMCLSAITWAGFDTIFYLFSHEESRDSFAIPHDLRILKEVFGLEPGGYRRQNAYWSARAISDLLPPPGAKRRGEFESRIAAIRDEYGRLSQRYQRSKDENEIPLN